jgi:hypothetical protein
MLVCDCNLITDGSCKSEAQINASITFELAPPSGGRHKRRRVEKGRLAGQSY